MEEIKVSVVVAVYNGKEYLEKCVTSICAQTWSDLEIILVDDGSEDGTGELCDILAGRDRRILVIHQRNQGVSAARNAGIEKAKGTYIAFVDSDDYLEREYVEKLVEQSGEGCLPIVGYYIDIQMPGRTRQRAVTAGKESIQCLDKKQAVTVYGKGLFSAVWNKLYKTDLLKSGVFFDSGYSLGEDFLFNLNYLKKYQCEYRIINQPLYHYMKRGLESLDARYHADFFNIQKKLFDTFLEYMIEIEADRKDIVELYQYYFRALIVAADNLYCNRSRMEKAQYHMWFKELATNKRLDDILEQLEGRQRKICGLRLWGLRHGMYPIDYLGREWIKRILGMK